MRVIGRAVDQFGADQIGELWRQLFGNQDAPAQCGSPRIGKGQVGFYHGFAVPRRQHAEAVRQVFDRDLGAQLVETELGGETLRQRARAVDQEAAAMAGRCLGDEEIR